MPLGSVADGEPVDCTKLRDEQLVARLRGRNVAAFEVLYDRYARLVFSVAYRVVGDLLVAEDVTQEVFLRLWSRSAEFDPRRGGFDVWLLSVARHRAIDERRRNGRRARHETF